MGRGKREPKPYTQNFLDVLWYDIDKDRAVNNQLSMEDRVYTKCSIHGRSNRPRIIKSFYRKSTGEVYAGCVKCHASANLKEHKKRMREKWKDFEEWDFTDCSEETKEVILSGNFNANASRGTIGVFICEKHGEWRSPIGRHFCTSTGEVIHGCPLCAEDKRNERTSKFEREVGDWIEGLGYKIERNTRRYIKSPSGVHMELDIVIPEIKVAIECNGEHTHREYYETYEEYLEQQQDKHHYRPLKWKGYHKWKEEQCRTIGYRLLQVWYREWQRDPDLMKEEIREWLVLNSRREY